MLWREVKSEKGVPVGGRAWKSTGWSGRPHRERGPSSEGMKWVRARGCLGDRNKGPEVGAGLGPTRCNNRSAEGAEGRGGRGGGEERG